MLWSGQKMLQIHCSISKGLFCFCLCYPEIFSELLRALCHTHTLSAASKGSLDHDRISDRFCLLQSIFFLINSIPAARNNRIPAFCIVFLASCLFPIRAITSAGGPIKIIPHFHTALQTGCSLTEIQIPDESHPPCYNSGAQNLFHCQIAVCRTRRSNADSLICQLCMQCIPVCFGVHSNRLNFHLPTRPDDPEPQFHLCLQQVPF